MGKILLPGVAVGLLFVSAACGAPPKARPNPVGSAMLWQARQYTHIKTIHFLAVCRNAATTLKGKKSTATQRYEYWGAGVKYRIDYQQFVAGGEYDVVVTDNGKHFRMFDRLADILTIGPTHPIHGDLPVIQNPILEPLIPLTPYFPDFHTPHVQWVNLARFARNPKSIFDRCGKVVPCGRAGLHGRLQGCILGSVYYNPAHVRFILGAGMPHPLVTGWMANEFRYPGTYLRLRRIKYRAFRLPSGRMLFLPVAYSEEGVSKNVPLPVAGPFTNTMVISHISLDKPIPAGTFTINYKLARFIHEVMPNGKIHYMTVRSFTPAPGHDWRLNKSDSTAH